MACSGCLGPSWPVHIEARRKLRASGRDIGELFGYAPDDLSGVAVRHFREGICPFSGVGCGKIDHSRGIVYGVCSVSKGSRAGAESDVIVCPERIYADHYECLQNIVEEVWEDSSRDDLVVGGELHELRSEAMRREEPVVAFGQRSGREVSAPGASMSMDWVLQRYRRVGEQLIPAEFVGAEVQSIDITGNYRAPWNAYDSMKQGHSHQIHSIPNSGHGLNWANVHKRLLPQIVRKGNLYVRTRTCKGFFFITPDVVFERFESILGSLDPAPRSGRGPA